MRSCNHHARAICHIRHLLTLDLAQTLACSLILSRIDYCNSARRSIQHNSEAPASPEQRGAYRSTSASTVRRQLAASDAALAACWTAHQLQVGRVDVQDSADVISTVSEPAHLVAHQRTQHSIVVRPTAVRAISTDIIFQATVQHCHTSDLELTATCRVKLRPSTFKSRLKTHLFSTAFC